MKQEQQRALIAIPVILIIGAGIALAGSQGGYTVGKVPVFVTCVALAFIIQWIAFVPAHRLQTEKFFDLTGSISYISVVLLALLLIPTVDGRAWLLAGMVIVWAVRLGAFLFRRILAAGEDRRFREIKTSFARFLLTCRRVGGDDIRISSRTRRHRRSGLPGMACGSQHRSDCGLAEE